MKRRCCKACAKPFQSIHNNQLYCDPCKNEKVFCACGCGQTLLTLKPKGGGVKRTFIHGHNGNARKKGDWIFPEESKEKIKASKNGWVKEKQELLEKNFSTMNSHELKALFPGLTVAAINAQAHKTGLTKTPDTYARIKKEVGETRTGKNNPAWKGGRWVYSGHHYGDNWHRQRRLSKERDNYTCQKCFVQFAKKSHNLHTHHIKPFRTFNYIPGENTNYIQANELDNLVSLCKICHTEVEKNGM